MDGSHNYHECPKGTGSFILKVSEGQSHSENTMYNNWNSSFELARFEPVQ